MDSTPHHKTGHHHQQKSSSELFSSAKVVAEAAQATFRHGSIDKARTAGAASDLLEAACQYGNLEEGKFGQYVEKAEIYMHKYQSPNNSGSSTTAAATTGYCGGGTGQGESIPGHGYGTATHSSSHLDGGHGKSEGGYGDYMKMAEGFFKNSGGATTHSSSHSGGGHGQSEGGYGDYFKMAEGFLKNSGGTTNSTSHSGGGHGQSEGGYGEYFKMAEGFLKKH